MDTAKRDHGTNISIRIDRELKEKLHELARKEQRTLANYLRIVIKAVIAKKGKI